MDFPVASAGTPARRRPPGTRRPSKIRPPGFHDMRCRRHAFDRLIKRQIQGVPGGGRDHRVYGLVQSLQHHLGNELDSAAMRPLRMSGEGAGNRPVARQGHIQPEKSCRAIRAISRSSRCNGLSSMEPSKPRITHVPGAVQHFNGLLSGQSGAISFRPRRNASMRCGSMKPSVIWRFAAMKRPSIWTGVPDDVVPRWACEERLRAS